MNDHDEYTKPIDQILEQVYARGKKLRRRRMLDRGAAMTSLVALLSGTMAAALMGQAKQVPPSHELEIPPMPGGEKTYTPTPKPEPTKTAKPKPDPVVVKPKPEETKPPAPKPELNCLNSFDPKCGEFFWKTKPYPKLPLVITVDAPQFIAGEAGEMTVHLSDGDALIAERAYKVLWGDDTYTKDYTDKSCAKAYGPWKLPAKGPDTYQRGFSHMYAAHGTYTVSIWWLSVDRFEGPRPCQPAYGSEGWVELEVTVVAPPEPDPTPTPS
ncbi:MAG: hypothetical protein ACRDKG_12025 [Actinomycetota bacterium]